MSEYRPIYSQVVRKGFAVNQRGEIFPNDGLTPVFLAKELLDSSRYAREHATRAADLFVAISAVTSPELPDHMLKQLRSYVLRHDLGKGSAPSLVEKVPLEPWERILLHQHPEVARKMLEPYYDRNDPALTIPWLHHERWNGKGYPLGLKGEEIPQVVRQTTLADVISSITYRRGWEATVFDLRSALIELQPDRKKYFDPELFDTFSNMLPKIESGAILEKVGFNGTVHRSLLSLAARFENFAIPPIG